MFNFGGMFQQAQVPPFNGLYRVFSIACKRKELENGDKILLPAGALDHLARLRVSYPMLFSATNPQTGVKTHCGVMEFSAEEGVAYLPYWMMQNLLVEPGGMVNIANVSLPKGQYVKLQPHHTKFTELSNPRVVLERALRNYTCLTKGDTILIGHGEEKFYLDVVEVKPGNSVCIIETDVNVDFAEPKDFKEYEAKRIAKQEELRKLEEAKKKTEEESFNKSVAETPAEAQSYFAKLGQGNRLSGGRRKAGGSPSRLASSSSSSSSSSSGARQSRLLSGMSGVGGSSSSSSSTTGGDDSAKKSSKFNYEYKTVNGRKKLARRTSKATSFSAFSGTGNSLK